MKFPKGQIVQSKFSTTERKSCPSTHQVGQEVFIPELLAHHRCPDDLVDSLLVTDVLDFVAGQSLQNLEGLFQGQLVTVGDLGGLEPHPQELPSLLEQGTGEDDDQVGSIADLNKRKIKLGKIAFPM